jgi:hypothetical protein
MENADQIERASKVSAGHRALADWVEKHPEHANLAAGLKMYLWPSDLKTFKSLARKLGGKRTKRADSFYYMVERDFGGGIRIEINLARSSVCTKRVVGTRHVEAESHTEVTNSPAHDEEIIEWDCPPALLAFDEDADGSAVHV